MKKLKCDNCGKIFYIFPSLRTGKKSFCCYKCKKEYQTGRHTVGNTEKCVVCGKIYYIKKYAVKKGRKCCTRECSKEYRKTLTGEKSFRWKTGVQKAGEYLEHPITKKKGKAKRILQHRRVMQEYLGRELKRNEVVHHIDGDKKNNDIDNLELMTNSEHMKYHWSLRKGL